LNYVTLFILLHSLWKHIHFKVHFNEEDQFDILCPKAERNVKVFADCDLDNLQCILQRILPFWGTGRILGRDEIWTWNRDWWRLGARRYLKRGSIRRVSTWRKGAKWRLITRLGSIGIRIWEGWNGYRSRFQRWKC